MDINYLFYMVLLIVMSAYFSATETAFSSLSKTRLKTMIEKNEKKKKAELALHVVEQYDKLISTILIGNNIVNISLASVATVFFMKLDEINGATISTVVITVIVLIFGEISPKSIAKDCPEKFAMFSAPIINGFMVILTPINYIFSLWKKLLAKMLQIEDSSAVSSEELKMIVDEIEQDGNLEAEDGELIKNAIEFTEYEAEEIITHRVDIEAVDIKSEKTEIAEVFSKTQFSRIIVYDGTIDNIVGIIHMKDFYVGTGITEEKIEKIMTQPIFVQRFEKINDLLKKLQKSKSHVAIVVDEYGGTLGMITMEDILEELVGEIWDEHDEIIEFVQEVKENEYIIDCGMDLIDFCKFFDISSDDCDCVLLSGWVMEKFGGIPEKNDIFEYGNLNIEILDIDSHKVESIKVIEKKEEVVI